MKRLIALLSAMGLSLCCMASVFAAENEIHVTGGTGQTAIELTAAEAAFKVTVPTSLPITVDADGNVTYATGARIVNESHGPVRVTNMAVKGLNGWAVVNYDECDMAAEKVDAKKIALMINNDKTTGGDAITFSKANFPALAGANSSTTHELAITYAAKLPAFSSPIDKKQIVSVVFTIAWDAA